MAEKEEITLKELIARKKKQGPTSVMTNIKAEGVVTILDKDGNVKSTFKINSIYLPPEE